MTWAAFVKSAYQAARGWDIQPSEFWSMTPQEWWWEFDQRLLDHKRLTKKGGGLSEADWADARKRHKERMSNG